ncbi:MAG: protoheme IX farnesyltransferase [Anaerolineales bacterium]|jgi:protoheme IX farnesyltransferase|uniref:heme o synthase n=1 Tax=Candidatus Villigracilis affinis TaxID=3140682 RepID=UPI001D4425E4|nr:protoheme IX farnesyltransferase [Anaerolineales bacterium]MBK9601195.1 protoheme IX farnesyltransferase [Anaerolineales bacterium]MBL0347600.1 protoheme IX farnesyltransferase [Anaerolineales bacterium]
MKYSLRSSFARLTLILFVVVFLLTVVGRIVTVTGAWAFCLGWPLCVPSEPLGYLKLAHLALVGVAMLLMVWLLRKAWREQRDQNVLLPLTTVTGVLFFGQALIGAVEVTRSYPVHLVVLHALTAVALWISLGSLVYLSGVLAVDTNVVVKFDYRQRAKDFFILSKPIIVLLLLVTTYSGLVAGSQAWPSASLTFWTLLGGTLAAAGSSALNQYIDRELDKNMQRTAKRPLADGRLTAAEGLSYGLALCLTSYYVMAGFVNLLAALLSLTGIFYYVFFYSVWLKKATVQNIVIGGGAGAIPPMVGWAAATGNLGLAAWILFAIVFMWTPPHFWALAIVRMKDYEKAGVPMMPVVHGEEKTRKHILIYTVELIAVTLLLPIFNLAGMVYAVSAVVLGGFLLYAAWRVFKVGGNKVAWTMYRWSSMYLAFIFLALMIDAVV